jgi:asparagine synthase (glutamine-hydrolysing)
MQHRGPDGTGLYLEGPIGFVGTRLAIIDLSGGDQPLCDESERFWVAQNGEIYNHVEIRERLEALGVKFRTRCDTEVIAQAFAKWGVEAVHEFNGAFAFVIYDRKEKRLFVFRDRLGKRPLFVSEHAGRLYFGSEVKAILAVPGFPRELDPTGCVDTLSVWSALDGTAFRHVRELPPGHYLVREPDGTVSYHRYWYLRFTDEKTCSAERERSLVEELGARLTDSTRLRLLRSDVPVGSYLSGGLDSSTIVAMARSQTPSLETFAVRFEDPNFDERQHQDEVAKAFGVHHDGIDITGKDIAEVFPDVVYHAEVPLFRTAPAPLFLLSKRVRQRGMKVVLTGEGADELFAGYHIFREDKVRRFWAKRPDSKIRPLLLRQLHPYLKQNLARAGQFLNAFFGRDLEQTEDLLYSHRPRYFNGQRVRGMLHRDLLAEADRAGRSDERLLATLPPDFAQFGTLGRAQYLEITTFFRSYLLHAQGDRMLMANSVEGRFPFLDHRVAEFAASLPESLRLHVLSDKYALRKFASTILPKAAAMRPKQPYRAPILRAFVGADAPSYVAELLSPSEVARTNLLDPVAIDRLYAKCKRSVDTGVGEMDEMALVGSLSMMLLHQEFIDRPRVRPTVEPTRVVRDGKLIRGRG